MDLIFTSFGVSHLPQRARRPTDVFYRMPPASLDISGSALVPDYAVLLLADRIVIDETAYDLLLRDRHDSYRQVALMVKVLTDEGFVRLENFDRIVASNRGLLNDMLERDLKELDSWVNPLKESIKAWSRFLEGVRDPVKVDHVRSAGQAESTDDTGVLRWTLDMAGSSVIHLIGGLAGLLSAYRLSPSREDLVLEALDSARRRRESKHRQALRDVVAEYLSYVNTNLLIANVLGTGFHDWSDFQPFYRDKLLRVARTPDGRADSIRRLFDVSFPDFTFWSPANIVRALKDKRIADLRRLVQASVNAEVEFDQEFANTVLSSVLGIERSIGRLRNLVSYVTMPLGFIPMVGTPVQKAVEEAAVAPIAHRRREPYRWFYLMSDLADRTRGEGSGCNWEHR
jgi:hypothetical protein